MLHFYEGCMLLFLGLNLPGTRCRHDSNVSNQLRTFFFSLVTQISIVISMAFQCNKNKLQVSSFSFVQFIFDQCMCFCLV